MERDAADNRHPACVEAWPECEDGAYHPSCCRFPKSCSCTIRRDAPPSDAAWDRGVRWDKHGDLIRTQLQQTGRIRLAFLALADLMAAVDDLGIDPKRVAFRHGYAVVLDDA